MWSAVLLLALCCAGVAAQSPGHTRHGGVRPPLRCEPSTVLTTPVSFGVGDTEGLGEPYANNMNCSWLLQPGAGAGGGSALTVVFTAFQLEYEEDYVVIYSGDREVARITGEQVVPYAVRVPRAGAAALRVDFSSDEAFHQAGTSKSYQVSTFQVGFAATFFDSSAGECPGPNGTCNGHGTCDTTKGECACTQEWVGSDCSVSAPTLTNGVPQAIQALEVGRWQYYRFEVVITARVVLELVDEGDADSDPFLVLGQLDKGPPSLTPDTFSATDWFDWYYSTNDVHFIRAVLNPGVYYVGALNTKERGLTPLKASVVYRSGKTWPCIGDCSGHGSCDAEGQCACEEDWTGHTVEQGITTCRYPITTVTAFPHLFKDDQVRVGSWRYFRFNLTAAQAEGTLLTSLWSKRGRARPLLLLAKDAPPALTAGLIPTYGAFTADFGDEDGFNLLQGHQQNIVTHANRTDPAQGLTEGTYYVGMYNVWGSTGIEIVSHATADVDLYLDVYQAGTPCPRVDDKFCNGETCDFNTGKCDCPVDKVGAACGFEVTALSHLTPVTSTIAAGETAYFVIEVTPDTLALGRNLQIVLTKALVDDRAYPYLLVRKGSVPYSEDYKETDDHDLSAHFYHSQVHRVLLDREELSEGVWYVSVENSQESEDALECEIIITFQDEVDCPSGVGDDGQTAVCSGQGECNRALGRCLCNPGRTLDDCSADGPFFLPANTDALLVPPVHPDDWAFWTVAVGCPNASVGLQLTESVEGRQAHDSAPLLVMRRSKLPLMLEGATDYYDYFRGSSNHDRVQGIRIDKCLPEACMVKPYYDAMSGGGTEFDTGSPEPGLYFVGLFNDASQAVAPVSAYSLHYSVTTCAAGTCAPGFVGETCEVLCPGMVPLHAYSNTPFSSGVSCSNAGTCVPERVSAVCECDPNHFGFSCSLACPGLGEGGSSPCNGHGSCSWDGIQPAPVCACALGWVGADCGLKCPGIRPAIRSGMAEEAEEGMWDGESCSGQGTCVLDGKGRAKCDCVDGVAGLACEFNGPPAVEHYMLAGVLAVVVVLLSGVAAAAIGIARHRKTALDRLLGAPMLDTDHVDSSGPSDAPVASDHVAEQEMTRVGSSAGGEGEDLTYL